MQIANGDADDSPPEDNEVEAGELSSSSEDSVVTTPPREVHIVDSVSKAQAALERLQAIHAAHLNTIFACDTEVLLCCSCRA